MTRCTMPSTGVSNSGWAANRIRLLEQLLGLRRDRAATERGIAFVRGVVERSPDGLHQLLTRADGLPTEAELDAPGLWLARLEL